jgi:nucleotide-binding universal stress UspA family protein
VSEYVLGRTDTPVLVVGPHAAADGRPIQPTLVAAVSHADVLDTAAPAIASWVRTFDGGPMWIADAVAPRKSHAGAAREMRVAETVRYAAKLLRATDGIEAIGKVLHGDPTTALNDFAQTLDDVVFVVVSSRWTDARFHRHSVTRRLVQGSNRPVLIVPVRRAEPKLAQRVGRDLSCGSIGPGSKSAALGEDAALTLSRSRRASRA